MDTFKRDLLFRRGESSSGRITFSKVRCLVVISSDRMNDCVVAVSRVARDPRAAVTVVVTHLRDRNLVRNLPNHQVILRSKSTKSSLQLFLHFPLILDHEIASVVLVRIPTIVIDRRKIRINDLVPVLAIAIIVTTIVAKRRSLADRSSRRRESRRVFLCVHLRSD